MVDTHQDKLRRMSNYFQELGLYTRANYCLDIIDYIDSLEAFQTSAFAVYPNIDIDMETLL